MNKKTIDGVFAVILLFVLFICPSARSFDCYGTSDVNDDGIVLSVADLVALTRAISNCGYEMTAPWAADITGDCVVDSSDYHLFSCYFETGIICLPFGFPLLTCCNPQVETVFIIGDANGNHIINVLDVTALIGQLYKGQLPPEPDFTGNANGDPFRNILDITYLISYLYKSGPAPVCPL